MRRQLLGRKFSKYRLFGEYFSKDTDPISSLSDTAEKTIKNLANKGIEHFVFSERHVYKVRGGSLLRVKGIQSPPEDKRRDKRKQLQNK